MAPVNTKRTFTLGIAGMTGSGSDTNCGDILRQRGFTLIRLSEVADFVWDLPDLRRQVAAAFSDVDLFETPSPDPRTWRRKRGVLGALIADDAEVHRKLAGILNPFIDIEIYARFQKAAEENPPAIALLDHRLARRNTLFLCDRTWFVERPDSDRHTEIEAKYGQRTELEPAYAAAKVEQIFKLQRDVVTPDNFHNFHYDYVLQHPGRLDLLAERIDRLLEMEPLLAGQPEDATNGETTRLSGAWRQGQFVRRALGLSQYAGRPLRITQVDALKKPGPRNELIYACVRACETVGGGRARVRHDEREIEYEPGRAAPAAVELESAARTPVGNLIQTVLPFSLVGQGRLELVLRGGTDFTHSTPTIYYQTVLFPLLGRLGAKLRLEVVRHGFFNGPMGEARLSIERVPELKPADLSEKGRPVRMVFYRTATASLEAPTEEFAEEVESFVRSRGFAGAFEVVSRVVDSECQGLVMSVILETDRSRLGADWGCDRGFSLAQRREALRELMKRTAFLLDTPAAVDPMCADKILGYLVLAGGRVTVPVWGDMRHFFIQVDLLNRFQPGLVRISLGDNYLRADCGKLRARDPQGLS